MDIQSSKIELVQMILNIENFEFIEKLKAFVKNEKIDIWDELSDAEKDDIQKGIVELDKGERVLYDDFIKDYS
jgi:hypothetical protein